MNHGGPKTAKPRRSTGGGRPGRMRPNVDKGSLSEGVYSNPRMTHAATIVIGCVVQVQVKNGKIYEGVFKTFSPQMDVVLEKAHQVLEDNSTSGPSAEELIEKPLILKAVDVVMMSALNVDLDYASKDSFTDTSISKFNGQVQEKELQPWECDDPSTDGGIEDIETSSSSHRPSNGTVWDPNEMFKTNMEKFNVSSSFDPSLSQYTTPLKQENTKEFKEREAFALKMAQEIENSDAYKASLALENGDKDEEDAFSAVVRTGGEKTDGRYVPPHQRRMQGQGRAVRTNSQSSGGGQSQRDSASPTDKGPSPPATSNDEPKINGEKEEVIEAEKVSVVASAASPTEETKPDLDRNAVQNNVSKDRKPVSNAKSRDIQIQELKKFSSDFKLSDNQDRKPRGVGNAGANASGQPGRVEAPIQPQVSNSVSSDSKPPTPEKQEQKAPPQAPPVEETQRDEAKRREETVKKSTLNPNAKEFVFNPNAKPFTPQQTSTTPRPQTQSPVMPITMYQPVPYNIVPQPHPVVQQQQQRPPMNVKKAVVSVQPRPEFVSQATGPPLMAHTPQSPYMPYLANPHQVQTLHRMMNPHLQQAHQGVPEQQMSQPPSGQTQAVFVAPPGAQAVPAHLGGQQGAQGHQHPTPAHVTPHHQPTPPHSHPQSTSHMNSQNQPNGPPTPGPVQHAPPPQHPGAGHPGQAHGHPPSSQTPQPHGGHIIYQQQPQGHPPLQPSPHTPTSPQNMYPTPMSYAPTYSYAGQTGVQGIPQMTFTHTAPQSTVTHAQHQQHQHVAHQPQFVMVQNPQAVAAAAAANQMQHAHHSQIPHGATVQAPHLQGKAAFTLPGPMAGQAGPAMMPQQFNVSSPNVPMHYVPHHAMPSQVGGPQYPHAS